MRYYVTGSNLHGQWLCEDVILSGFRVFTSPRHEGVDVSRGNLLQINWSYNIFRIDGSFYVTGAWDSKEQQQIKIPLPVECIDSKEFIVVGNDYKIILVGKSRNTLWVIDLKKEQEIKKINFSIEEPFEVEDSTKKQKIDNSIKKADILNDSCLYLTLDGNVYCGLLPSYVDTRQCKGKICDIKCGYEHFVLLTDEGRVYTWGNGRRLQLGHGDVSNQDLPTEVDALAGIKIIKISAGGWHSLALSIFGDVYAWGWNDIGQLGIRNLNKEGPESYSIPTLIDLFDSEKEVVKNIKDIACGSRHSAIVLEDNTVWTTGCNKYGQLGFSEEKYPSVNYFRKAFHCDTNCSLQCGPWSTVIISK